MFQLEEHYVDVGLPVVQELVAYYFNLNLQNVWWFCVARQIPTLCHTVQACNIIRFSAALVVMTG